MAKKPPATKGRSRPRQGYLPTMEPPSIPEIDAAADKLADVRGQRIRLTDEEGKLAEALLGLMHKHELKVYEYEGKRVEVAALEKVKVRRAKDANGEAEQ